MDRALSCQERLEFGTQFMTVTVALIGFPQVSVHYATSMPACATPEGCGCAGCGYASTCLLFEIESKLLHACVGVPLPLCQQGMYVCWSMHRWFMICRSYQLLSG